MTSNLKRSLLNCTASAFPAIPCNGVAGIFKQPDRLLTMVLWLTALHSISIGLTLIVQPADLMKIAGFDQPSERFFPTQGGVFHILMAVAYLMGAADIEKYYFIIVFSIIVKAAATFFLMVYCFTVDFKWIILLSGIGDLIMGLSIFAALQRYLCFQKYHRNRGTYE